MIIERKIRLVYPKHLLNQPLIYELIRRFDLVTNILEAEVTPDEGRLVLLLRGDGERMDAATEWMAGQGVELTDLPEGH